MDKRTELLVELAAYAQHTRTCSAFNPGTVPPSCTCGLRELRLAMHKLNVEEKDKT